MIHIFYWLGFVVDDLQTMTRVMHVYFYHLSCTLNRSWSECLKDICIISMILGFTVVLTSHLVYL